MMMILVRIVITLELEVDMRHQLRLCTHAITCPGRAADSPSYRHAAVASSCAGAAEESAWQLAGVMESVYSNRGVSLDWEEFQVNILSSFFSLHFFALVSKMLLKCPTFLLLFSSYRRRSH